VILNTTEEDQWGVENVEFCTSVAIINGSHVTLSQYLQSFLFSYGKDTTVPLSGVTYTIYIPQFSVLINVKYSTDGNALNGVECCVLQRQYIPYCT